MNETSNSFKSESILAIDPSIRACGVAIFLKGKLVYVDVIRTMAVVNQAQAIQEICDKLHHIWQTTISDSLRPELLVVEKPQIYQQAQLKGDPNDLIPLALMSGVLWEKFKPKNLMLPTPKEWKGQVPKNVMTKKTCSQLSKQEIDVLSWELSRVPEALRHNGFDSIGIGLWARDRFNKRIKNVENAKTI